MVKGLAALRELRKELIRRRDIAQQQVYRRESEIRVDYMQKGPKETRMAPKTYEKIQRERNKQQGLVKQLDDEIVVVDKKIEVAKAAPGIQTELPFALGGEVQMPRGVTGLSRPTGLGPMHVPRGTSYMQAGGTVGQQQGGGMFLQPDTAPPAFNAAVPTFNAADYLSPAAPAPVQPAPTNFSPFGAVYTPTVAASRPIDFTAATPSLTPEEIAEQKRNQEYASSMEESVDPTTFVTPGGNRGRFRGVIAPDLVDMDIPTMGQNYVEDFDTTYNPGVMEQLDYSDYPRRSDFGSSDEGGHIEFKQAEREWFENKAANTASGVAPSSTVVAPPPTVVAPPVVPPPTVVAPPPISSRPKRSDYGAEEGMDYRDDLNAYMPIMPVMQPPVMQPPVMPRPLRSDFGPSDEGGHIEYRDALREYNEAGMGQNYADGGGVAGESAGILSLSKKPGFNLRDITDIVFDPSSTLDKVLLPLLFVPPIAATAQLIKMGYKGASLTKAMAHLTNMQQKLPKWALGSPGPKPRGFDSKTGSPVYTKKDLVEGAPGRILGGPTTGRRSYVQGQVIGETAAMPFSGSREIDEFRTQDFAKGGIVSLSLGI